MDDYHGASVKSEDLDEEHVARSAEAIEPTIASAQAEAKYAAAMWNGEADQAKVALENVIDETGKFDALNSGWESVWLGAALEMKGDPESATIFYRRATNRLGNEISLPTNRSFGDAAKLSGKEPAFVSQVYRLVSFSSNGTYSTELTRLRAEMSNLNGATPRQMEEAVRVLGEALGYSASRPDNDIGTGPDVLWLDDKNKHGLAFELKTDEADPAKYRKKEIGQGHDHLVWVRENYAEYECLGLLFVGPDGSLEPQANPSDEMWHCTATELQGLRDILLGLIGDIRNSNPTKRLELTIAAHDSGKWTLAALSGTLKVARMKDLAS